jgi:Peroxisomal biogenesis factor 11 (PEX11)
MSNFPTRPHSLLALPFAPLDDVLSRLSIITSTPQGTDSLLRTACYTLQFLVGAWNDVTSARAQAFAAIIASRAKSVLLPGETLLVSVAPATGMIVRAAPKAKAMSSLISEFRTFTRLWGLLGMYSWGKSLITSPPEDTILWACAWLQCAAYTAYQVLENRAYLAGKGIVSREGGAKGIVSDWLWSTRMWMIAVVVEFVRLARARTLRMRKFEKGLLTADEEKTERESWWRELLVNTTNAPLTVHWSVDGGTMSDTTVGFLAAIGGAVGLRQRWKAAGSQLEAAKIKAKAV